MIRGEAAQGETGQTETPRVPDPPLQRWDSYQSYLHLNSHKHHALFQNLAG
jgi:hypothetical protein